MAKHSCLVIGDHMWLLDCGPTSAPIHLQAQHCTLFHAPKYLHVRYTQKGGKKLVSLHMAAVTTDQD